MDKFELELLSSLKSRLEAVVGPKDYQKTYDGNTHTTREFYLENLEDNLFGQMSSATLSQYQEGDGNEL